jgi:CBS domain-containing protein
MNREMTEIIERQVPLMLPSSTSVQEACRHMHDRKVGAVLVTNERNQLVGIFTGRDAVRMLARGRDAAHTHLKDVMTRNPATISPKARAIDALRLMRDGGFRHVPIVENGMVRGIVSRNDFRGLEQDRMEEEIGMWEHMR